MQVVILTTNSDAQRQVRYLGPYQIAWWLRENGYETQVLDYLYFMTKDERTILFKKFITKETKVIGFAPFITPRAQRMELGEDVIYDMLHELKENFPWAKIVIGGAFVADFLADRYKRLKFKVDMVFRGEAEHSFLEYVNYACGKTPHPRFSFFNDQKIMSVAGRYDIEHCSMKYAKNDFILPGESLPFELSRGCIFKCNFCQYPNIGKTTDDFNKSMESIRESLISNYELFGTTQYHLADDTLNSHRQRTKDFHRLTKELPFKIEYVGYVRMDLLDIWPEQIDLLPESGLTSCHFGVESLDPLSCKQVGKGWGAKNHKKWIQKLRHDAWKDDVIMRCSLIAGLGKETPQDWENTTQWMLENKIHDFIWQPLYISTVNKISMFDKDPEHYGFKITGTSAWVSDSTNYYEAKQWCTDHQRSVDMAKQKIPSAWEYAAMRTVGFSSQEILNSNYYELYHNRVDNKKSDFLVQEYIKTALRY